MNQKNLKIFGIPLALIIINLIIKGIFICSSSVAGDEPFSIYYSQYDISSIIDILAKGNNPPLYEILLHFWSKLFGISALSVRIPSLIFNSLTVVFIYKMAKLLFNYKTALVAGLLFTFSNYQIAFAHEARVYSLLTLLSAISMFLYSLIIFKNSAKRNFTFLILIDILLIYSHYFGFFVLFIQFLYMILLKEIRQKYWKHLLAGTLLLALCFLPFLSIFISRFLETAHQGTWIKPPSGIEDLYNMIWAFSNAPVVAVSILVLLLTSLVKFILDREKKLNKGISILLLWFWVPLLLMFVVSFQIPMFISRYMAFISPAFYIIAAYCANYIFNKKLHQYIILSALTIMFIITVKPNITNKRDESNAIQKVRDLKTDETLIIVCPKDFIINFAYHYDLKAFGIKNVQKLDSALKTKNIYFINSISEIDSIPFNKVVYLDAAAGFSFPDNHIIERLSTGYKQAIKFYYPEIYNVYEFIRP